MSNNYGLGSVAFKQQPQIDMYNDIPMLDMPSLTKRYNNNNTGLGNIDGVSNSSTGSIPEGMNINKLYGDYLQSGINMNKANYNNMTQDMKWADVKGLGDAFDYFTSSRKGGSSYADIGITALKSLSDFYFGNKADKYKRLSLDLANRQQAFYENQIARQNTKEDKAQAGYDAAQAQTRVV